jgi:hypothetical protein
MATPKATKPEATSAMKLPAIVVKKENMSLKLVGFESVGDVPESGQREWYKFISKHVI